MGKSTYSEMNMSNSQLICLPLRGKKRVEKKLVSITIIDIYILLVAKNKKLLTATANERKIVDF